MCAHTLFEHKVFMCLVSFPGVQSFHASSQCGVSSSRDCGTVSLFSLRICSSTHHVAASGSSPADRLSTAAEATLPNLNTNQPLYTIQHCGSVQHSSLHFQVICLCGLLSVCALCNVIIILLCKVMFHKAPKCRGV